MNTNKPLAEIVQNYFEDNNLIDIKGTFLEAGAFDGIYQSNTLFLEKYGWKGVLVEPSFENYLKCLINRPNTISVNSALVSLEDYKNSKIIIGDFDSDIMSSISAKRRSEMRKRKYKRTVNKFKLPITYLIDYFKQRSKAENNLATNAITLSALLEYLDIENLDFLSLDVEGYEFEVLNGIDFTKHKPKIVLIEIYNSQFESIRNLLDSVGYSKPINLTNFSFDKNPNWDGTHNDYLFLLK